MSQSSPSPEKLAGGEKKASRRKKRGKSFILAFDFSSVEQSSLLTASELRVKIYTSVEREGLSGQMENKQVGAFKYKHDNNYLQSTLIIKQICSAQKRGPSEKAQKLLSSLLVQ